MPAAHSSAGSLPVVSCARRNTVRSAGWSRRSSSVTFLHHEIDALRDAVDAQLEEVEVQGEEAHLREDGEDRVVVDVVLVQAERHHRELVAGAAGHEHAAEASVEVEREVAALAPERALAAEVGQARRERAALADAEGEREVGAIAGLVLPPVGGALRVVEDELEHARIGACAAGDGPPVAHALEVFVGALTQPEGLARSACGRAAAQVERHGPRQPIAAEADADEAGGHVGVDRGGDLGDGCASSRRSCPARRRCCLRTRRRART